MKLFSSAVIALLLTISIAQPVFAKSTSSKAASTVSEVTPVNLNQATAKEIAAALKGIGLKKAQAIVNYRNEHGKFKAIEELASVKGVGVATIAKNHSRILLK